MERAGRLDRVRRDRESEKTPQAPALVVWRWSSRPGAVSLFLDGGEGRKRAANHGHCASVFGVSTESMQLSYDSRGNCVPVILLLLQSRLYDQGGLQIEGIFRITGENSEEEYVREQLNKGLIPDGIDVHCLAGLIKAWFRELPRGVLDPLPAGQVMQCESDDDFVKVVRLLPQTEASLLNWAINLMADVVQFEHVNKMNSRNLALVFAPNMSKMADPLTALMYAVQVMKLLKSLTEKTLGEREATSTHVDTRCSNEAEEGEKEEEEEEEEEMVCT
ncbi:hypothetical protein YC2023_104394 [Brassica napus]